MNGLRRLASARRVGALLLVLGATSAAAPQGAHGERVPVDELMQSQVFALLTSAPDGDELDRAALLESLTALGAPLAPVAAGILCGEIAVPETAYGSEDQPVDPRLVELRDGLLREALGRLDRGVVVDHLARRAAGEAPLEVRLCVARLLGESRHPRAVDVLLQIAAEIEPIHLERAYVLQAFEQPLAAALRADPRADTALAGRVSRYGPQVRDLILRAAAQADSAATRRFLCSRLDADEEEQGIVLGAIAAAPAGAFQPAPDELGWVRARLRSSAPGLARLAALALGRLEDGESLPELIDLLDSEDALEARAALDALRWISGSDLGRTSDAWRRWLRGEEGWWQAAAPTQLDALSSGDRLAVHRALLELRRHPLFRHELAPEVAQLLYEEDEVLAVAGCETLAALGSREALPALFEALALPEGALHDAALRTLQAMARRDPALREYLAVAETAAQD